MDELVNEMYLSELYSYINNSEDQSTIGDFGGSSYDIGTTVAVVRDPTGGIVEACDMHLESLGMPLKYLNELRSLRNELDIEDDLKVHNEAVERLNLEDKYRKHLKESEKAQRDLQLLQDKITNGEKVTVVCFEKPPKWCHRHVLTDVLKDILDDENND